MSRPKAKSMMAQKYESNVTEPDRLLFYQRERESEERFLKALLLQILQESLLD
jgi:hypothetical protein